MHAWEIPICFKLFSLSLYYFLLKFGVTKPKLRYTLMTYNIIVVTFSAFTKLLQSHRGHTVQYVCQ